MASLPEKVNPGDLITAELITDMLAALRGVQGIDDRLKAMDKKIDALAERVKRLEQLVARHGSDGNDMRGLLERLRSDRDDMRIKIDDVRDRIIPAIDDHFTQIETGIATRFDPIEQRIEEVELRAVRDSDPIERLHWLRPEQVQLFRDQGITNVAILKARQAEIPALINNADDAVAIGVRIGRIL
jgi:chromosome segregation ATPase